MKKIQILVLIAILVITISSVLTSQSSTHSANQAYKVIVFDFHVSTNLEPSVGADVAEAVHTALGSMEGIELIDMDAVQNAKSQIESRAHPYHDLMYAINVGNILSADFLITGGVIKRDTKVDVNAKCINLQSGKNKRTPFLRIGAVNQLSTIRTELHGNIRSALTQMMEDYNRQLHALDELKSKVDESKTHIKDVNNMVPVRGASTEQGAADLSPWDGPLHTVYVSDFHMDMIEVTNWDYATFLTDTQPDFDDELLKYISIYDELTRVKKVGDGYIPESQDFKHKPVVNVSWYGAQAFCEWADKRLPTEAEWEYAAGGGTYHYKYGFPGDFTRSNYRFDTYSPINVNEGNPNNLNIYHLVGNVYEWCYDWFRADYYNVIEYKDPKGPTREQFPIQEFPVEDFPNLFTVKSVRGGAYNTQEPEEMRVERRWWYTPDDQRYYVGFRCVSGSW